MTKFFDVFPAKNKNKYIYINMFSSENIYAILFHNFFLVSKSLILSLFSLYFSDGEGRKL